MIKEHLLNNILIDSNGCWNWQKEISKGGYGRCVRKYNKKLYRLAHRLSFRVFVSLIPKGICILHKCDNRACINPDHLFLGTHTDNMRDMVKKGRGKQPTSFKQGSQHTLAKLTESQVLEIKLELQNKTSRQFLAKKYFVSVQTIDSICWGTRWNHVKISA